MPAEQHAPPSVRRGPRPPPPPSWHHHQPAAPGQECSLYRRTGHAAHARTIAAQLVDQFVLLFEASCRLVIEHPPRPCRRGAPGSPAAAVRLRDAAVLRCRANPLRQGQAQAPSPERMRCAMAAASPANASVNANSRATRRTWFWAKDRTPPAQPSSKRCSAWPKRDSLESGRARAPPCRASAGFAVARLGCSSRKRCPAARGCQPATAQPEHFDRRAQRLQPLPPAVLADGVRLSRRQHEPIAGTGHRHVERVELLALARGFFHLERLGAASRQARFAG